MIDFQALNDSIKELVDEAVTDSRPTQIRYGTVVAEDPNLTIRLTTDAAVELGYDFLEIPKTFTELELEKFKITTESGTPVTGSYKIEYDNRLKLGDKVVLIQQKGGQKFAVMGRCE